MSTNMKGAGFHQFSGLSCPVLNFFTSFYVAGNIDCGFGTIVINTKWNKDKTSVTFDVVSDSKDAYIIVCMNSKSKYTFTVDGKVVRAKPVTEGAYAIKVGGGKKHIEINI